MNRVILAPEYFGSPVKGIPVALGSIYVGVPDLDPEVVINQKQVSLQLENGTLVPVAQPVLTGAGGYPMYNGSPVTIMVEGDYSLKVLDSLGAQVYYVPEVKSTVLTEDFPYVDIRQYGADASLADNTAFIQAANDYANTVGKGIYIPEGTFICLLPVSFTVNVIGAKNLSIIQLVRGFSIDESGLTITNLRFTCNDLPLYNENGQVTVAINITDTTFENCQFGDVINTASAYTDTNPDFNGSYCVVVDQEGCKNTVFKDCLFKNMHKTTVTDAIATDGFTGGVVILTTAGVIAVDNASTVRITDCVFDDMSSPGATAAGNSDADGVRQFALVTNDNERFGALEIRGCTFTGIIKSGIKVASFSDVMISDCSFYSADDALFTFAAIRLQYALNSSVSDVRLYGEFQYGVVSQGGNVAIDGVYHSNKTQDAGGGQPQFGTVDGKITNTFIFCDQAVAGDYLRISNVIGINVKQALIASGVVLTEKAGWNNVIVDNFYATLNDFLDTAGNDAVVEITNVEKVIISNMHLLMPLKDDGTFDNTGLSRQTLLTNEVNELHISNSTLPYYSKAVYFRDIDAAPWFKPQACTIDDTTIFPTVATLTETRVIDVGTAFTTDMDLVKLTNLDVRLPMSGTDAWAFYQSQNCKKVIVDNLAVTVNSVGTNYVEIVRVESTVDKSLISNILVTAVTDLGALTQEASNPVVYAFDAVNCSINNIDGSFQDGVIVGVDYTNGNLSELSSFYTALFIWNSAENTTSTFDFDSIKSNGVRLPFYQSGGGTPVAVKTPRRIGDVYFDTVGAIFWDATGLTNADWKARS